MSNKNKFSATALILAGGKSKRFGRDKAFLEFQNKQIITSLAEECQKVCNQVLIVSDSGQKFSLNNVEEIGDNFQDAGPMGGLQAGLEAADNDICFLVACDMPLVTADLIRVFLENVEEHQILLAKNGDDIEPMFGIYRKSLLPKVEEFLRLGRRSLLNLLKVADVGFLSEEIWGSVTSCKDVFFNINFKEDYDKLLKGEADHSKQTSRKNFYKQFFKG